MVSYREDSVDFSNYRSLTGGSKQMSLKDHSVTLYQDSSKRDASVTAELSAIRSPMDLEKMPSFKDLYMQNELEDLELRGNFFRKDMPSSISNSESR